MTIEINGELRLDLNESIAFIANMRHPNINALRLRDEFLQELADIDVNLSNGEIVADFPNICLPSRERSLYDEVMVNLDAIADSFSIEQAFEDKSPFSPVFMFEKKETYTLKFDRKDGEWTTASAVHPLLISA